MSEFSTQGESQDDSMRSAFVGDSSLTEPPKCAGPSRTPDLVSQVICDVIASRARGERVCTEQVIASHPELMPGLREELQALDAIHRTVVLSQTRAPSAFLSKPDAHQRLRIDGYSIEREISSGGQATVFKAVQERTGRSVAIKVMHGGAFMGSRARKRFERESRIMAGLNHPNIVSILDKGRTADGSFYLVMDFVEGCSLDAYVRQLVKETSAIIGVFAKVAHAVNEAHRLGIIHRDLKPMNILVDCRGEPHILDFGMARVLHNVGNVSEVDTEQASLTYTGQVLGSLPWASPEQVFGSPDAVDARSDVYALGVMLFVILAGEFPYPVKGNPRSITHHVANTPPPSLTRLAQRNGMTVTSSLEEIVFKALSKSPSQRYASAGLLAQDLEGWLAGKPSALARRGSHTTRWLLGLTLSAVLYPLTVFVPHWFEGAPTYNSIPNFTNTQGMFFVRISAGTVLVDRPKDPRDLDLLKTLFYRVDQTFYLSATDVTQEQYLQVLGRKPADPSVKELNFPVQCVKWADAVAFCDALGRRDKRRYRLPTQAEWRYALFRGMSENLDQKQIDSMAWYAENSGLRLHAVALKSPDHWGLYDMIGDVRQWCCFSPDPVSNVTTSAKLTGKSLRLAEGADFLTPALQCLPPSTLEKEYKPETSLPTIGFRVVCESP